MSSLAHLRLRTWTIKFSRPQLEYLNRTALGSSGEILTLGAVSQALSPLKSAVCAPADRKLPDLEPGSTSARGRFQLRCAPVGQKPCRLRAGEEIVLRVRKGVLSREESPSCVRPSWRFFVSISSSLDSFNLVSSRLILLGLLYHLVQLETTLRLPCNLRIQHLGP